MKKYLMFCGILAVVACSKKEVNPNMDSNVMLEEPVVKTVDSAAAG